jgi:hypothetical protein
MVAHTTRCYHKGNTASTQKCILQLILYRVLLPSPSKKQRHTHVTSIYIIAKIANAAETTIKLPPMADLALDVPSTSSLAVASTLSPPAMPGTSSNSISSTHKEKRERTYNTKQCQETHNAPNLPGSKSSPVIGTVGVAPITVGANVGSCVGSCVAVQVVETDLRKECMRESLRTCSNREQERITYARAWLSQEKDKERVMMRNTQSSR